MSAPIPERDRRSKELGLIGHITETLVGKQSRKVAFGIWLFIVANSFKVRLPDMPWDVWWKCVLLAGALIGLGTVLDEIVSTFGKALATATAKKVNAVIETKTTVTTETPSDPTATA